MWWGAVAGAVAAGASLMPESRLLAGAVAGGAMLALAVKVATPCCDGCASGDCAGDKATPGMAPDDALARPNFGGLDELHAPAMMTSKASTTTPEEDLSRMLARAQVASGASGGCAS